MPGTLKVGGNIIASHTGVEGAGTVTLQNTTLDSGVVFPAGHIIQTVYNTYGGTSGTYDSDSNTELAYYVPFKKNVSGTNTYYWSTAINNVKADSHVIVMMKFNYEATTYDYDHATYGFCIFRGTTNPVTSHATAGSVLDNGDARGDWIELKNIDGSGNLKVEDQNVLYYYDSSPATGTNVYTPAGTVGGAVGGTIRIKSGQYQQPFQCVLQEVAQ